MVLILSGCSYTKYGLNVAVTQNTYEEELLFSDSTVGTSGKGFKVGLVEELPYFITRINYFHTQYDNVTLNNVEVELEESGLDYSIGLKLWRFQPRIVGGSYKTIAKSDTATSDTSHSMLGFGLAYEQPLNENHYLFIAYDVLESSDMILSSWQRLSIGYRWNFATFGKKSK